MKGDNSNKPVSTKEMYNDVLRTMFTQVSAREGIQRWGDQAIAAIVKELKKLQEGAMPGKPVIEAIDPNKISEEDKRKCTLEAVTVIK